MIPGGFASSLKGKKDRKDVQTAKAVLPQAAEDLRSTDFDGYLMGQEMLRMNAIVQEIFEYFLFVC